MSRGSPGGRPGRRVISSVATSQITPVGSAATRRGVGSSASARSPSTLASRSGVKSGSPTSHPGRAQRRRTSRWGLPRRSITMSARFAPTRRGVRRRTEAMRLPGPTASAAQLNVRSGGRRRRGSGFRRERSPAASRLGVVGGGGRALEALRRRILLLLRAHGCSARCSSGVGHHVRRVHRLTERLAAGAHDPHAARASNLPTRSSSP